MKSEHVFDWNSKVRTDFKYRTLFSFHQEIQAATTWQKNKDKKMKFVWNSA